MLRCVCQARLGRNWRFCESCGRPVPAAEVSSTAPDAGASSSAALTVAGTDLSSASDPAKDPVAVTPAGLSAQTPAQRIDRLDWRFALAPLLVGVVLSLPAAWWSAWWVLVGAALGLAWGGWRWRAIHLALQAFTRDWIFERVTVFGPCALGTRVWWPTGVLYLTDQTLKFKPFDHANEREVSLDPLRVTGVDFPATWSWPSDWRCLFIRSSYGPVFGVIKVFDRVLWEQHLMRDRQGLSHHQGMDAS